MEESVELSHIAHEARPGAADAQHGPAPPGHARGAAAAAHARGRGRARRQADHRLRPHRHREDRRGQGVLEGHPRRRADGLPLLLLQRDGLLRRRRDADRPRGPAARAVPARRAPRAQPDRLAPDLARDRRAGPRRDLDLLVRLARPRPHPRPLRDVLGPAHAHALLPGRRRDGGHPARLRGARAGLLQGLPVAPGPVRGADRQEPDRARSACAASPPSTSRRCWTSASPARCCARPATRGTCARPRRTPPTTTSTSRSRSARSATTTTATASAWPRCASP